MADMRSKTGCGTCKDMRKRCDEDWDDRGTCGRCRRVGTVCRRESYRPSRAKRPSEGVGDRASGQAGGASRVKEHDMAVGSGRSVSKYGREHDDGAGALDGHDAKRARGSSRYMTTARDDGSPSYSSSHQTLSPAEHTSLTYGVQGTGSTRPSPRSALGSVADIDAGAGAGPSRRPSAGAYKGSGYVPQQHAGSSGYNRPYEHPGPGPHRLSDPSSSHSQGQMQPPLSHGRSPLQSHSNARYPPSNAHSNAQTQHHPARASRASAPAPAPAPASTSTYADSGTYGPPTVPVPLQMAIMTARPPVIPTYISPSAPTTSIPFTYPGGAGGSRAGGAAAGSASFGSGVGSAQTNNLGGGMGPKQGDLSNLLAPIDPASATLGSCPTAATGTLNSSNNNSGAFGYSNNYAMYNGYNTNPTANFNALQFPLPDFDPTLWQNLWDPFFINDAASGLPVQQDRSAADMDPEMVREIDDESSKWWTYYDHLNEGYFVSLPKDRRLLLSHSIHKDAPDRIQRAGITVMVFAHYASQCEAQARLQRHQQRENHREAGHGGGRDHGIDDVAGSGSVHASGAKSIKAVGIETGGNDDRDVSDTSREAWREWDRKALKVAAFARQALEGSSRAPGDNLGPILDLRTAFIQRYSPTEALELLDLGTSFLRRAKETAQLDMQHSSALAAHLTLFSDTLQCIVDVDRKPLFDLWACPHRTVSDDLYLRSTPGHLGLSVDLMVAINGVLTLNDAAHVHARESGSGRSGHQELRTPSSIGTRSDMLLNAATGASSSSSTTHSRNAHTAPNSPISTCAQRLLRDIVECPAIPPSADPGDSASQLAHTAMHELWRQAALILLHTVGLRKGCLAREVQKCIAQVRFLAPTLRMSHTAAPALPFWASASACPWFIVATVAITQEDRDMCKRALGAVGDSPQYEANAAFIGDYWARVDEMGRTEDWRGVIKEGGYRLGFL